MTDQSREVSLLPCPFCGYKEPKLIIDEYAAIPALKVSSRIEESIICPNCLSKALKYIWNTRKPQEGRLDEGEVLKLLDSFMVKDGWRIAINFRNIDLKDIAKAICQKFSAPGVEVSEKEISNIRAETQCPKCGCKKVGVGITEAKAVCDWLKAKGVVIK